MPDKEESKEPTTHVRHTLGELSARQLAVTTKTVPMMEQITPRWLVTFLSWVPVEAGTYRVNKVKPTLPGTRTVECSPDEEVELPEIFVDYEEKPREYTLSAVTTTLDVHTRVSDLYRSPHDQIKEQLRLTVEKIKERQERESSSTTRSTGCSTTRRPKCPKKPGRAPPRPTIGTSSSRRFGRSPASSSRTREASPLSAGSAPTAASRRPRRSCSVRRS